MNAAELHALYAPLWEKVPETRPVRTTYVPQDGYPHVALVDRYRLSYIHDDHYGDWGFVDDLGSHCETFGTATAAALCREAAEDWLETQQAVLTVTPPSVTPTRQWCVRFVDAWYTTWEGFGPSRDHALVQAVMYYQAAELAPAN